ncbi:MAG TPA: multicopper oxidase domain-containing protein, partial [Desulfobaccales bacterium]
HYRFRILNGCQARFHNLQLYYALNNDLNSVASGEVDLSKPGPRITQIGTEGGFLPVPVALPSNPSAPGVTQQQLVFDPIEGNALYYNLLLAPAERADLIIDFTDVPAGSVLILYSDAPAPFPGGDPRNDYYTGDPDYTNAALNPDDLSGGAPSTNAGFGPNTRTLLQFRVANLAAVSESKSLDSLQNMALANAQNAIFPAIEPLPQQGVKTRRLTLNETFDYTGLTGLGAMNYGRLIQMLGTDVVQGMDYYGVPIFYQTYEQGRGEVVKRGTTEIWEIINNTGDTHPMHFHLVNVQVLSRQAFDDSLYLAAAAAAAPGTQMDVTPFLVPNTLRGPDPNELGWKET